ncbi:MAG: hypothetical protein GXP53_10585 [Deltaproteobacteria bacterium]|nr:hypothetical protein [Deltaproteobacteria bacterium]
MSFYKLPTSARQDIDAFEKDLSDFLAGRLHETAFTSKRVQMGVYMERSYKTYMCRIRCPGNFITPGQLRAAAVLAEKYGDFRIHVTTRAEIQIHGILLENLLTVFKGLTACGLSSKGGGGNTIRNIITNHDSGINPSELFDVQPHALALTERLIEEPDSFEMPRKLKIAFSSMAEDASDCRLHDFGFIACKDETGKKGFKVYAGGGLGANPRTGILLHEFLCEDKIFQAVRAVKDVFHARGNRKNKNKNRIRFLIHDDLGADEFKRLYQEALEKIYDDDSLNLDISAINNQANGANQGRKIDLPPFTGDLDGYETWAARNVSAQKQEGLFEIKLALKLGDLKSGDCAKLADALAPFGENVLRCGVDQNFYIRNIGKEHLKTMYQCILALDTLSDKPELFANLVPCTGAQTCQIGINFPRPAATAIFKELEKSDLDLDLMDDVQIRISGCPNSCARHWSGDLCFYGKVRRVEGYPIPTYNVLGGARITASGIELAETVGWVHSRDLPRFINAVLHDYGNKKTNSDHPINFTTYWRSSGSGYAGELCKDQFNDIPTFEEDKNYYFDHGAKKIFSIADMGKDECSAGIYDMIDVDVKIIKKNVLIANARQSDTDAVNSALREIAFSASRMLLVTRGEDPKTPAETYDLFIRHFLDTGIVAGCYRKAVETARDIGCGQLIDLKDVIINFGEDIIALYKGMDNTMRFPGETENLAIKMAGKKESASPRKAPVSEKTEPNVGANAVDRFKDLRGVRCPINFAQTKVQLAMMKTGQTLRIYLDDGEPIANVPGSVKRDGHEIIRQEMDDDYWVVEIRKA